MMEKLGAPQTHLSLKSMIREVDEDGDSKISFREVSSIIVFAKSYFIVKGLPLLAGQILILAGQFLLFIFTQHLSWQFSQYNCMTE